MARRKVLLCSLPVPIELKFNECKGQMRLSQRGIKRDGLFCGSFRFAHRFVGIDFAQTSASNQGIRIGPAGICKRIAGVSGNRVVIKCDALDESIIRPEIPVVSAL